MILDELNSAQLSAVMDVGNPLLVLAGAGSGKTSVITKKIAFLILNHGVPPNEIFAITFTNRAADEMRDRIQSILGENRSLNISTFHSLGLKILRSEAPLLGFKNRFSLYDVNDCQKLISAQFGIKERKDIQSLQSFFSKCKNMESLPPVLPDRYLEYFEFIVR